MGHKGIFSRLCDSVGDGTGVTDLADDYSGGSATAFKICPPVGEIWYVVKLIITVTDSTAIDLNNYGISLTNGINLSVMRNGAERDNLTPDNIMSVRDWGSYTGAMTKVEFGIASQAIYSTWNFDPPISLNGGLAECLQADLDDNFSSLVAHKIVAHRS